MIKGRERLPLQMAQMPYYEGLTWTSQIAIISAQDVESAVSPERSREYEEDNHGEKKCSNVFQRQFYFRGTFDKVPQGCYFEFRQHRGLLLECGSDEVSRSHLQKETSRVACEESTDLQFQNLQPLANQNYDLLSLRFIRTEP